MHDRLLVSDSVNDIPHIGIGCRRFRSAGRIITHTAVFYRDADEKVWALHFGAPRLIIRDDKHAKHFGWAIPCAPEFDQDSLTLLADLCELIYNRYNNSQEILYGLRFSYDVKFGNYTGEIELGEMRGVTCATFVLAIFNSYGFRLLDIDSWEPRDEDVEWQHWISGVFHDHDPDIASEMPCLRFRPQEVVGTCMEATLDVPFQRAAIRGDEVLRNLDAYLERSGLSV